jgi:radical SAM-linked protein
VAQLICRYRKEEKVRWISHLDLKRTLERAMRRAELPLALSQGHNPHPRVSFGPPLPMGATGEAELLAIQLDQATDPGTVKARLNAQLPPGLSIVEVWAAPAHKRKETFGEVDVAEYQIIVTGEVDGEDARAGVGRLLEAERLVVQRGGERPEREVDLRPLLLSLQVVRAEAGEVELHARLKTGSHGGARPQEIVSLLGLEEADRVVRYHRVGLHASAEVSAPRSGGVWRRWSRSRGSRERN